MLRTTSVFAVSALLCAPALGQLTLVSQVRTISAQGYSLSPVSQSLSFSRSAPDNGAFQASTPTSNFPFAVYAGATTNSVLSASSLSGAATVTGSYLLLGGGSRRILGAAAADTLVFSVGEPTSVRLIASGPRYSVIFDGPFADGYIRLRSASGTTLAACEPVRSTEPGTFSVANPIDTVVELAPGTYRLEANCTASVTAPSASSFISGESSFSYQLTTVPQGCDPIDFNQDGLFPDDRDLIDFLSVLAGGSCSAGNTCNDIDFNNDSLFPDDSDLIAFLRVLAGGSCA